MPSQYIKYIMYRKYSWNISLQEWLSTPPGYSKYEKPGNDLEEYGNGWQEERDGQIYQYQQYVKP